MEHEHVPSMEHLDKEATELVRDLESKVASCEMGYRQGGTPELAEELRLARRNLRIVKHLLEVWEKWGA